MSSKRKVWKAHKAAERAVKEGKIKRGPPGTEMHHPDYNEPLRVVWVTPEEHAKLSHKF